MKNNYYNKIAYDYHLKRKRPWKPLESFLNYLKTKNHLFNGFSIDLGCANGRNFKIFKEPNNKLVGIDSSYKFLEIARGNLKDSTQYSINDANNIQLILGDLNNIPIRADSIQTVFSIATIHHIKDVDKREKVIKQIANILKENGNFILTIWRKWQKSLKKYFIGDLFKRLLSPKYRKQQNKLGLCEFGDRSVPWTLSKEGITYNRFYHFFSKHEIKKLLKRFKIKELKSLGGSTNKDNFFVLVKT